MSLSDDPKKRGRQLANLKRGNNAQPGNQAAKKHGGYAAVAQERLETKVLQIKEALEEDAPLRRGDGKLPTPDHAAITLLAECMSRLDDVSANIRDFGLFDQESGALRPVVELEQKLRREAGDHLDALGMTPRSRAKLGLDLQRTVDLATAMSEPDPVRRAELLEEAGVS